MNVDTFEALQEAGFDEKQATVLAVALGDIPALRIELRSEMDALRTELRSEIKVAVASAINDQTWKIVGSMIALAGLLALYDRFLS